MAYLRMLEYKNDIYQEIDVHPLGAEEKDGILLEEELKPDISSCWNREILPGIVPRLYCWVGMPIKYSMGYGIYFCHGAGYRGRRLTGWRLSNPAGLQAGIRYFLPVEGHCIKLLFSLCKCPFF